MNAFCVPCDNCWLIHFVFYLYSMLGEQSIRGRANPFEEMGLWCSHRAGRNNKCWRQIKILESKDCVGLGMWLSQWSTCPVCMEPWVRAPALHKTGPGDAHLESQHVRGGGRRISSGSRVMLGCMSRVNFRQASASDTLSQNSNNKNLGTLLVFTKTSEKLQKEKLP